MSIYFRSQWHHRVRDCPRQTEVCDFDSAVTFDQDVLRLEVSVEDLIGVSVPESLQNLRDDLSTLGHFEDSSVLQVAFQVEVHELEHETQVRLVEELGDLIAPLLAAARCWRV